MLDDARRRLTSAYTLPQTAPVDTSTGPSDIYLDGVALLLSHRDDWRAWLEAQLIDTNGSTLWPVAQGQSGALLLGILGRGTLHAWGAGRRMGPQWRNLPPPNTTQVALIDDCLFSGATMRELTTACQQNGWQVVKRIICALREDQ